MQLRKTKMPQVSSVTLISIVVLAFIGHNVVDAQIFDRLFSQRYDNRLSASHEPISADSSRQELQAQGPEGRPGYAPPVKTVSVPLFYDMVKQGSSLGINVLSGLVKVERGDEAQRSGLFGPRPLSVRVFGIPVYERGTRMFGPNPSKPEDEPVDEEP